MASLLYLLISIFLLGSVIGEPQIAPELFLNKLNISYGINYKYNGQLNHNTDRVWVVTKIKIPQYEEIRFPNISFDPECKFLDPLENGNTQVNIKSIKQLCRDSAPLIYLFQYKEDYKQQLIKKLLDEDLQQVLKGKKLKHKRSAPSFEVPQSNESLVQNSSTLFGKKVDFLDKLSNSTPPSYAHRAKRGFTAFIPALASLATIAVESIGLSFKRSAMQHLLKVSMLSKQTNLWHGIPLNS